MSRRIPVDGYCPACGHQSLAVEASVIRGMQRIACFHPECPDTSTVDKILSDPEIHHIVRFNAEGFNAQHPLRERAESELLDCSVHDAVVSWLSGLAPQEAWEIARERGTWRAKEVDGVWSFEQLP